MSILPRALSLSLLLIVALATASSARPPWGRGEQDRGPGSLLEEHADQLGLDEETREAIRDVVRQSRESNEELRDELRGLHRQMKEMLSQDDPDETDSEEPSAASQSEPEPEAGQDAKPSDGDPLPSQLSEKQQLRALARVTDDLDHSIRAAARAGAEPFEKPAGAVW